MRVHIFIRQYKAAKYGNSTHSTVKARDICCGFWWNVCSGAEANRSCL